MNTKSLLILGSVAGLGLTAYSFFHSHKETFKTCLFCGNGIPWITGFIVGITILHCQIN